MAVEKKLVDVNKLRDVLYEADAITMKGVAIINQFSTVDATPVTHGEWIVCGDGEYVPFMCSACGKTTSWYHAQAANYCSNCGAKMDGGGDG